MNPEIEFGEVAETPREKRLRPDHNKHFAVAPVFSPDPEDLPVFVDVDAICDMEDHALSDTRVELGGVLLGGQYEDAEGQPFVLVTDSLRAKHYESTKGSFKFTHETWAEITREREEFPEELQMVGWYHTHPDWGVFLSSMDMFICDHFFNKPLDVALVIDPCRQDRGFFQWTGDPGQRVRRTGGFFLVASRFRADELDEVAQLLEGQSAMAQESRFLGARTSAPVVNISGTQPAWQANAVLGMLMLQFCFLLLIAVRMFLPDSMISGRESEDRIDALQKSVDRLAETRRLESEADAKLLVLDQLVASWDGGPEGIASALADQKLRANELEVDLRAERTLVSELDGKIDSLTDELRFSTARNDASLADIAKLENKLDGLLKRNRELKGALSDASEDESKDGLGGNLPSWFWPAAGGSAILLVVAGTAAALLNRRAEQIAAEDSDNGENSEDPPIGPNN